MERRDFLKSAFAFGLFQSCSYSLLLPLASANPKSKSIVLKRIPSTKERIPALGMGTWITFNVGKDTEARNQRSEVLRKFFDMGGKMIDSSPMYGSSEEVIGFCLNKLGSSKLFSATKIWTSQRKEGSTQFNQSLKLWRQKKLDLVMVHNLVSWEAHLELLRELKSNGLVRYIGVTTSHGRRHDELQRILKSQSIDFVQLTYNAHDREAEQTLLPLAAERNVGVIANRPFQGGDLIERYQNKPLPKWSKEVGCENWPQFLLRFVISHPSITCAIPATSQVAHMEENMGSLKEPLPNSEQRMKMLSYLKSV